jgi:hypothetical protein
MSAMYRTFSPIVPLFIAIACIGCSDDADPEEPGPEGHGFTNLAWTFEQIDGALCGLGDPTGIGINPNDSSKRLHIFLEDGGVCFNAGNCTGADPSAANFEGFGDVEFAEFTGESGVQGLFDRDDPDNPFRDDSFVFFPYCTGDVHAGSVINDELHFVGQDNLKAAIPRILEIFPNVEEFIVSGQSAGGFGAMYNYFLFQDAFGDTPGMLIDDSGPFFTILESVALVALINVFGFEDTVDPDCALCLDKVDPSGGLVNLIPHYADKYPGRRVSLISSLEDENISGQLLMTPEQYDAALNNLADNFAPSNPDFRVYFLAGDHHVWSDGDETTNKMVDVVSEGVPLSTFLQQQVDNDPAWANVRP